MDYPVHHQGHSASIATSTPSRPADLDFSSSNNAQSDNYPGNSPPTSPRRASIPMDASKLNHAPAPLPIPATPSSPPSADPLRSPEAPGGVGLGGGATSEGMWNSAYLDENKEAPQHPTVAETGALGSSPTQGPGPATGQLHRRESDAKRRIIRLASFGGEGLQAKPPVPCPGEQGDESAIDEQ